MKVSPHEQLSIGINPLKLLDWSFAFLLHREHTGTTGNIKITHEPLPRKDYATAHPVPVLTAPEKNFSC